jgi:phosphoribosyl-ATP pyrophosphohydrolase/phosphoribosyl-AMP cyclohydrolase/histidinol dehydrogenase
MAGGAQAVTAMAYGTDSVVKCDKILGPGNQFVTAAKMYVQNDTQALCSIDMPAGPSEVLVIADGKADPDFVASDLLSQAEHGVDSQVILLGVDLSDAQLAAIELAVKKQAEVLPRKEIVAKCLAHSYTLLVESYEEAFKLSNDYAPEHLILQIENASSYVPQYVENAGSVFVGKLSPESCGDYSSGTNHTLPTYGYARQYSGVNTATFQKFITSQEVSEEGLKSIGKAVMTIAAVEGLEAHRNAVHVRMEKLGLL